MKLSRFWMGLLLIGVLLCGLWFPAAAQVYEQEMPADWQEKDILRITAFAVGEGDALLLQCGGRRPQALSGSHEGGHGAAGHPPFQVSAEHP